jgi:hypothetical protein
MSTFKRPNTVKRQWCNVEIGMFFMRKNTYTEFLWIAIRNLCYHFSWTLRNTITIKWIRWNENTKASSTNGCNVQIITTDWITTRYATFWGYRISSITRLSTQFEAIFVTKIQMFCAVTSQWLVNSYRHFERAHSCIFRAKQPKKSFETSAIIYHSTCIHY